FGGAGIKIPGRHDIGNVDSAFSLDNRALRILLALAHMFFHHVRAFDDQPLLFRQDADHAAALAFIGARDDHYFIVLFYVVAVHEGKIKIKVKIKSSDDFGGEGDDLHEFLVTQLAGDGPEDAGAARVQFFINDHNR